MVIARMEPSAFHKMVMAAGRFRQLSLAPLRQTKRNAHHRLGVLRSRSTTNVPAAARMLLASHIAGSAVRRWVPAVVAATAMRRDNVLAASHAALKDGDLNMAAHVRSRNASLFAKASSARAGYNMAMGVATDDKRRNIHALVRSSRHARLRGASQGGPLTAMPHAEKPFPRIAPMGRAGAQKRMDSAVAERRWRAEFDLDSTGMGPRLPSHPVVSQARLSDALAELLNREARLPPSGTTGFDPRLSPAWPGLKLLN
jgi:hypothetical protein